MDFEERKDMKKTRLKQRISLTAIVTLSLCFSACDESSVKQNDKETLEAIEHKLDEMDSKRAVLVESIIRSSPTLAETGEIFADIGMDFKREYLNDINNVSQYTTLRDQGINLGVFLADLGYITTFEQSQEIIFYMNSAQKMAEGIGVSDVFDEKTVERMEMNISDKDSIIELISELYWKTDEFLKELNRENISALIICGGWVEGMHIASSIIEDGLADDNIYLKMTGQQKNLKKILSLLETFDGDEGIEIFEARLAEIDADFNNLPKSEGKEVSPEQKESLNQIALKIESLREEII